MKTKELIKALQEEDPTGETEVCDDHNHDIHFVERQEAYWDGRLQRLIRDESKSCYNIIGAKVTAKGYKIKIHTLGVEDAIYNDPDLPVDLSELKDMTGSYEDWKQTIEGWRKDIKRIIAEVDAEYAAKEKNK